ncbi:hypothetical protein RRG08_051325 [Elysia crispata]|uniref:C2H2-type domain-containing protein n=1 Tax=Elysia crispata TaxID=231223 RepID=A0AAE1B3S3_9GAST|nr:hypothetical protein RRG08_051325 [Elysia crispata]
MYCSKRYFCPVPDCVTKSSKSTGFTDSEMKRHWSEKHEEFVLMYHCSQCNFSAKRKGNILRHFRTLHRYLPFSSGPQQWKGLGKLHSYQFYIQRDNIGNHGGDALFPVVLQKFLETNMTLKLTGSHRFKHISERWTASAKDSSQGCPVKGCSAKKFRDQYALTRHWAEKHEKVILKFCCTSCSYSSSGPAKNEGSEVLWAPGYGCPVPGCGAKRMNHATRLREHWLEKHEQHVSMFHCSECLFHSKRRSNLHKHFKTKHPYKDLAASISKIDFQPNPEYNDPGHLRLEDLLNQCM